MESIGRCVAIILLVIFLFLCPMRYRALAHQLSVESYIETELLYLQNNISQSGEITRMDVEYLITCLSSAQYIYELYIEVYQPVYYDKVVLEYENALVILSQEFRMELNEGDYFLIRVERKQTFIDRIKNLFIPTFPETTQLLYGGYVQ